MRAVEPDGVAVSYAAVLDALPIVSYMGRPDGSISFVSSAWRSFTGFRDEQVLGDAFPSVIYPEDLPRVLAAWQSARDRGIPYRDEFRLLRADGSHRWVISQAAPLREPSDGSVLGWIGTLADIHESKLNESRLRENAAFTERLLESSEDCIKVLDLDARLLSISSNSQRILRIPDLDAVRGTFWPDWWSGDARVAALRAVADALASETGRFTGSIVVADERRWFDVVITPILNQQGRPERLLAISRDVTEQHHADEARARIAQGLHLLARTGAAMVSLDYRATLENIARACVEEFASYCLIDIVDAAGRWKRTAAHRDRALEEMFAPLAHLTENHPIVRAARTGFSGVFVIDEDYQLAMDSPHTRAIVARLGIRSVMIVPVATPEGTVVGALTVGVDRLAERDDFRDEDLPFVQEVGRRAGVAIANAQLYERERKIAVELQAASLPLVLPRVAGLQLDAEYRPGSDEATIGGDWYDAFVLDDGRVAITVGDVLGHGLRAAVTMTKLRQAMQTAALIDPNPNSMLAITDRTMRSLDPDSFATAIAAIYDPRTQTLSVASAGHPGPAIRTQDGGVEEIVCPGLLLGLGDKSGYPIVDVAVPSGSTMVFFTDGLVEATRDLATGHARLHEALRSPAVTSAAHPARAIVEHVLGGDEASDDVAVLVVRIDSDSP